MEVEQPDKEWPWEKQQKVLLLGAHTDYVQAWQGHHHSVIQQISIKGLLCARNGARHRRFGELIFKRGRPENHKWKVP